MGFDSNVRHMKQAAVSGKRSIPLVYLALFLCVYFYVSSALITLSILYNQVLKKINKKESAGPELDGPGPNPEKRFKETRS